MRIGDTTWLAVRNLREAVLRTALTAVGVAIGIGALVCMMSFGVAMQDQVTGNFLRSGLFDSITVTPAGQGRPGPRGGQAARARTSAARVRLDDAALQALAKLDKVREVYPDVRVPVELAFGDVSEVTTARGVPMSSRGEGGFRQIAIGRFFRNESEPACLISLDFARRIATGDPKTLLGKPVTLRYVSTQDLAQINPLSVVMSGGLNIQRSEKFFTIVGILERPAGPTLFSMFSSVMIPLAQARSMGTIDLSDLQNVLSLGDKRSYTMAVVRVRGPQDTEEVEAKIKKMGLNAFSIADALQSQKKAFVLLDLFLLLVGSIALTVASLGIVNTMVMSILERTREIGVMKAIGASDPDVRWIFLIEASLIGLVGGVAGIALGWLVGKAINFSANYYLRTQDIPATNLFTIPWWLAAGGIGFAVLVSLLAGCFPAARAARLDPIQALRHD